MSIADKNTGDLRLWEREDRTHTHTHTHTHTLHVKLGSLSCVFGPLLVVSLYVDVRCWVASSDFPWTVVFCTRWDQKTVEQSDR